ncbi:MAG: hypothetical protein IKK93_12250 [Campylobacter sp.]|nr:hypothetical protein [Campylobacter sp.]
MIEKSERWMKRVRNLTGFLGMILPWIVLLSSIIYANIEGVPDGFWKELSISETYYIAPVLAGILTTASVILMCYDGYDWRDNLITSLAGIFGLFIVIFPCNCPMAPERVGIFQLPAAISDIIHTASALTFFVLLAINSCFLFTLGDSDTKNKRIRKVIYRICGIGMVASASLFLVPSLEAKLFIIEAIALTFFGISWLVKGRVFGFLED